MKRSVVDVQTKLPQTLHVPKDGKLVESGGTASRVCIVVGFNDDLCQFLEEARRL